jgi:hypothetical protein
LRYGPVQTVDRMREAVYGILPAARAVTSMRGVVLEPAQNVGGVGPFGPKNSKAIDHDIHQTQAAPSR